METKIKYGFCTYGKNRIKKECMVFLDMYLISRLRAFDLFD